MQIVDDPEFLRRFIDQDVYVISENKVNVIESKNAENAAVLPFLKYKGNNTVGVAVCISENSTDEEKKLLADILKSVKLSVNEIALFEIGDEIKSLEFPDNTGFRILISFGITSVNSVFLNIKTRYSPTTVETCRVLISDSLTLLVKKVDLKKKLWTALKSMF